MKKKLHLMAFVSLLAAATFSSCNNDDDDPTPPSGAIESNAVAAEVENFGNIALDSIVAVADDGKVTVGSGAYSNGKLTVTLSAAVGSSALHKIETPSGVKVSNPNVKIGEVAVYAYKSGSKAGKFSYGTAEWNGFLMYVDGDVSMTGSYTEEEETVTYSVNLKKGWNIAYQQTSGASITVTTAKPQDAKWSYQSEQYDELKVVVVVYDEDSYKYIPVGSATFSNGELKLPTEAVGSAYLSEIFEGMPTGVTVSKPDVKGTMEGSVHAYKAGAKVGELSLGTAEWRSFITYVEDDVNVSGTGSFTEEEGESNTISLSLTLKKGWNIVYAQDSEESETYTTTAPEGAKWDFIRTQF